MELYKLTGQDNSTFRKKVLWGENITIELPVKDLPELCSGDVIHAYKDMDIAYF